MSSIVSVSALTAIKITNVKADKTSINLLQGQTNRLKTTLTPSNTTQKLLKYYSANVKVAAVTAKGAILGVGEGTTYIQITSATNNKITTKVTVNVTKNKPVTLTAFTITHPSGISKEATMVQVAKATGVTINWVNGDAEKFKVLAASSSLPDIIENEGGDIQPLISSGAIISLDSLLDKYGSNIKYREAYALKAAKEVVGKGIATYYIPIRVSISNPELDTPSYNGAQGMYARYDIYQAIGSPKINNPDDYLNVLKKMQDYQQNKIGNKAKVYAISAWVDWGAQWAFTYGNGFIEDIIRADVSSNAFTGKLTNSIDINSPFWQNFAFWNKAYRMGLVDPEAFVQKWDQMIAKVNAGTVITESASFAQPDPKINGEKAGMYVLPGVKVIPAIFPTDSPIGYGPSMAKAITKNCKYPDRAMQFFDYMASDEGQRTVVSGVRYVDWNYINGIPQIIGNRLKAIKDGTIADYDKQRGISKDLFQGYQVGTDFICDDGYPADLLNTPSMKASSVTAADKNFVTSEDKGKKGLIYPGQVYAQWQKEGKVKIPTLFFAKNNLMTALSTDLYQVSNTLNKYIDDNYASLIMANSEEEFNAVKAKTIAEIKKIGSDKIYNELLKKQAEAKVTADLLGSYK